MKVTYLDTTLFLFCLLQLMTDDLVVPFSGMLQDLGGL